MIVDAPTLMVKYFIKTADVTFPKYLLKLPAKAEARANGIIIFVL